MFRLNEVRPRKLACGDECEYLCVDNVPETPREIRAALNTKILHGRFIEDGTWHHVMDWAHAHGHDELANLFRSTGRSTPIDVGPDDDGDYDDDE
jgi:hypothetical protein